MITVNGTIKRTTSRLHTRNPNEQYTITLPDFVAVLKPNKKKPRWMATHKLAAWLYSMHLNGYLIFTVKWSDDKMLHENLLILDPRESIGALREFEVVHPGSDFDVIEYERGSA